MTGVSRILLLALLAGVAQLGEARAGDPEVWIYQCMEDEDSDEKICTTEISTSTDNQDFLIYFVHNKGGKSPLVVTGEDQEFATLTIRVDKEDPIEADECGVGLCFFQVEKSRVLLRQFRKGRRARISIVDDGLDFILDKNITLRGFSATFAKH